MEDNSRFTADRDVNTGGGDVAGRDHNAINNNDQSRNQSPSGGTSAVNISFGDRDHPRPLRPLKTMDDLYFELSRQIQQANDKINKMSLQIARLEYEVIQLQKEIADPGGRAIAISTLVGVLVLAAIGAAGVWVLSNAGR